MAPGPGLRHDALPVRCGRPVCGLCLHDAL